MDQILSIFSSGTQHEEEKSSEVLPTLLDTNTLDLTAIPTIEEAKSEVSFPPEVEQIYTDMKTALTAIDSPIEEALLGLSLSENAPEPSTEFTAESLSDIAALLK